MCRPQKPRRRTAKVFGTERSSEAFPEASSGVSRDTRAHHTYLYASYKLPALVTVSPELQAPPSSEGFRRLSSTPSTNYVDNFTHAFVRRQFEPLVTGYVRICTAEFRFGRRAGEAGIPLTGGRSCRSCCFPCHLSASGGGREKKESVWPPTILGLEPKWYSGRLLDMGDLGGRPKGLAHGLLPATRIHLS